MPRIVTITQSRTFQVIVPDDFTEESCERLDFNLMTKPAPFTSAAELGEEIPMWEAAESDLPRLHDDRATICDWEVEWIEGELGVGSFE